ncbi:MAG TPA: hypothetical protein VNP20_08870 [Nocardioidaceae bacterium]|nr:hypothetical protein [Nocardioidaceae bacterium]
MPGRVQVKLATNLFIDDQQAMRESAYERLRDAWSGDEDFPYASASDVPFDEVVHSLVADAVPLELPGCRRSAMEVEVGEQVEESEDAPTSGDTDDDGDSDGDSDTDDQDNADQDDADQDTDDQDTAADSDQR